MTTPDSRRLERDRQHYEDHLQTTRYKSVAKRLLNHLLLPNPTSPAYIQKAITRFPQLKTFAENFQKEYPNGFDKDREVSEMWRESA